MDNAGASFAWRTRVARRCLVDRLVPLFVYFALRCPSALGNLDKAGLFSLPLPGGRWRSTRRRNIARFNRGCAAGCRTSGAPGSGRPHRSGDFETGDVQIGRHQRKWLVHASSTAAVPSASRVAVGEGWISQRALVERTPLHRTRGRTKQHDAVIEWGPSGDTTLVAYPRLVHGDGPLSQSSRGGRGVDKPNGR